MSKKASSKGRSSANPFVPEYLFGRRKMPKHLPDYIGFGDENEAVAYAADAIEGWRKSEGAPAWLAEMAESQKSSHRKV